MTKKPTEASRPATSDSESAPENHTSGTEPNALNASLGDLEIYRTFFERANDAIIIADANTGMVLDANARAEELFDCPRSQIVGLHQSQLHPKDQMMFYRTEFQRHVEQESAVTGQAEIQTCKGVRIPIDISSNVVHFNERTLVFAILRDISAKVAAEKALRRSEERFLEVVENISEVFWLFDWSQQKVVYVSPAYEKIWGRPVEALYGRYEEWAESIHPEDLQNARTSFERAVENGGGEPREYRIVRPDGSVRWISDVAFAVRDARGQVQRITGIAEDVTERKQAEAQMRMQHTYMLALHDTALGLVRRLNIDELLKEIIDKAAHLLNTDNGYLYLLDPVEQHLVMRVGIGEYESLTGYAMVPGQGLAGRVLQDGKPIVVEDYRIWEHRIGKEQFENLRAVCGIPLRSGPDVIGVLGLSHTVSGPTFGPDEIDIMQRFAELAAVALSNAQLYASLEHELAQRQRAENALRLSQERYRTVVKNANDAICIAQDDKFVFYNPRTLELLECTAEYLSREPFSSFIHPDDLGLLMDRYRRRLNGENPTSTYSIRVISKKGTEHWVQLNAVRIEWEAMPAVLILARDISHQKHLELQLQQAQKMEAIGTLAGGIAHDFNNLLMGIQGRTSIMLMDTAYDDPYHEHLREIEAYVKNAADLTRQLLGFARGGKYEVKTTQLNELIAARNRMFGRTKKEISIHEKFAADLWAVDVDRSQIEQVLLNVYINAWQAMPDGGELFVQTENLALDELMGASFQVKPGRYVKVSVADTGIGMDAGTRRRIFEPFFTTRTMGRGTGMGLASAYGIVRNHGGHIRVESEKGHGTTMHIYLPASRRAPAGRTAGGAAAAQPKGRGTILLVDDEQLIIDVGVQLLERLGYNVIPARSGREAVTLFAKNRQNIDLVILDLIMPDMSGKQTFDELVALQPDVSVILSSGYSLNGEASQILQKGCVAFIQKPYTMENLARQLQTALKMKRNPS